jgi:phosphopantetheinyl transferase
MLRWAIPLSEVGADASADDSTVERSLSADVRRSRDADADDERAVATTGAAFAALVRLLPKDDAESVLRFRNPDDQHRALLSRLAQRAAPAAALGLSSAHRRQAANGRGRPFLDKSSAQNNADARDALAAAPNWNYSASHEGGWVALAAEPLALCGCDVAAPRQAMRCRQNNDQQQPIPFLESVALLRESFTDAEWDMVQRPLLLQQEKNDNANDNNATASLLAEAAFLRLWAVKEAFVKARGDGLAFAPLSRIEAVWKAESVFEDAGKVAAAAASGARLAVGTLSIDGGAAQWGRWAVAVHPLPAVEDEDDREEEEVTVAQSLSPRTPGVSPVPSPPQHRRRAWLAVVRGPPSETAPRHLHPDFVDSLARRSLDGEELRRAVEEAPWPPLKVLKVGDLLLDEGEREAVAAAVAAAAAGAGARQGGESGKSGG